MNTTSSLAWLRLARSAAILFFLYACTGNDDVFLQVQGEHAPSSAPAEHHPRSKHEEPAISTIVDNFNHASGEQRTQLQEIIECYVERFDETKRPKEVCLEDYTAIAAARPKTKDERAMVRHYFGSLSNRITGDRYKDGEEAVIRATATSLPLLAPDIFEGQSKSLVKLVRKLIQKLNSTTKEELTENNFALHQYTIEAIHRALSLLSIMLDEGKWDRKGLCKDFGEVLEQLVKQTEYYPYHYHISLVKQSLSRLTKSASYKSMLKDLWQRTAQSYKGGSKVYATAMRVDDSFNLALASNSAPSFNEEIEEMQKVSTSEEIAQRPWYEWLVDFNVVANAVIDSPAQYDKFNELYKKFADPKRIVKMLGVGSYREWIMTAKDRKAFYYGVVRQLTALAKADLPAEIREGCHEHLNKLRKNSHWSYYEEIRKAIDKGIQEVSEYWSEESSFSNQSEGETCGGVSQGTEEDTCAGEPENTFRPRRPCSLWRVCVSVLYYTMPIRLPYGNTKPSITYTQGPSNPPAIAAYSVPPLSPVELASITSVPTIMPRVSSIPLAQVPSNTFLEVQIDRVNHLHEQGDKHLSNKEYRTAINLYHEAIELWEYVSNTEQDSNKLAAIYYGLGRALHYQDKYAEAVAAWTNAAERGNARAQTHLGWMYSEGINVVQDYNKAFEWLESAAEQNYPLAQMHLGALYEKGEGVDQNACKAYIYYEKAFQKALIDALAADPEAQFVLGVMYKKLYKLEESIKWFRKAANQGSANAQFNLGMIYANGLGVEKDEQKAVELFRKAAEQRDANAQCNLGWMYQYGQGVIQDYRKAARWYRKAAKQGLARAQNRLGDMYYLGRGVAKNDQEAGSWYHKAAAQGFVRAQYNLGVMHQLGHGVEQDDQESARWYREAAEQGHKHAEVVLKGLLP